MKKLMLVLTMLLAFALSSVAFAADGGDLNKEQRSAEKMLNAFNSTTPVEYTVIAPTWSNELNKNIGEKGYAEIKKQVKAQFGELKETKFYSFERFDQGDRVTYIAAFSKEKVVIMAFMFAKDGKLQNFNFAPYKAPEQAADKK